jgi:hypothetical protein
MMARAQNDPSEEFEALSPFDEDFNSPSSRSQSPSSPTSLAQQEDNSEGESFGTGTYQEGLRAIGPNKAVVIVPPGTTLVKALKEVWTPEYYQKIYKGTEVGNSCSLKDGSRAEYYPPYERKNNSSCHDKSAFSMKGLCWKVSQGKALLGYKMADFEQCLDAINQSYREEVKNQYREATLQ